MTDKEAILELEEFRNYKRTYYGSSWFKVEVCADDEMKEKIDKIINLIQTQQEEIERLKCNNEILQGELDRIGIKTLKLEKGSSTDDVIAEIEKLRNNNKDLLRKLRNRVKEVKKLTKYSLYKTEFSTLNKQLEKKDKIIDGMANHIATTDSNLCQYLDMTTKCKYYSGENKKTCDKCIKEYFINKVEKENKDE